MQQTLMPYHMAFDFRHWNADTVDGNVRIIILLSLFALAVAFTIAGICVIARRKHKQ